MQRTGIHHGWFAFVEQPAVEDENQLDVPDDLTELDDDALTALEERLVSTFDELYETSPTDVQGVEALAELADAIEAVRGENTRRTEERQAASERASELRDRIHAQDGGDGEGEGGDGGEGEGAGEGTEAQPPGEGGGEGDDDDAEAKPPQAVAASSTPAVPKKRRLNLSIDEIRRRQPVQEPALALPKITAAADVPGAHAGQLMTSVDQIAQAFSERARTTPVSSSRLTTGPKVIQIAREHKHQVSSGTSAEELTAILAAATSVASLVAAGGWCAPSEITYELFNIAAQDGLLDLPTIGITRGGIKFPVSPTLADVLSEIWVWTEQDDIDAVTGTGTKPCARVPCVDFDEERLDAIGLCVTAGNLTEAAYPELVANFVSLIVAAHFHVVNKRNIDTLVAASVAKTIPGAASGAAAPLLNATELSVIDLRAKYGMADDAVLEAVYPSWVKGAIRGDMAQRSGADLDSMDVTDAMIASWFDDRSVRAQFVQDYQVRSGSLPGVTGGITAYPGTVEFMVYPAGTFALGRGPTIDLGVVRDSVLNATNDHTAAWSEESNLIAMLGHESRKVTTTIAVDGVTGCCS